MAEFILALDQGTTSSRAIVFGLDGRPRAVAQRELRQIFPQPGWVEHDPEKIFATQRDTARAAIAAAGLGAQDIAAVGLTNQRETTVVWERASGRPIHNAIVWQDRRTANRCAELKAAGAEIEVRDATGLLLDPYFSATKIAWLLEHVPGARARAERGELCVGTIDSWLAWRLSGGSEHVTDPSNASRTLLFDLRRWAWSDRLCELFAVPPALLPRIVPSSAVQGTIPAEMFGAAIPLAGIAGDQQAALHGQGCAAAGSAKNTYGTGCFLLAHNGSEVPVPPAGILATAAAQVGAPSYALEGSVFIGGAVVQWLRDGLGIIRTAQEVEALAAQVTDCGDVYLVPAFAGLGAPYWDASARGVVVGLTRGSSAAHIARAALESIALQCTELVELMAQSSRVPLAELRVDGGAAANDSLMQLQADCAGIPILRPQVLETTALGAARLAATAVGLECRPAAAAGQRFEPRWSRDQAAAKLARWRSAVARARDWAS
jgi:glycerol kinase